MKERINILETYPKFLEFLRRLNRNNYLSRGGSEDARDLITVAQGVLRFTSVSTHKTGPLPAKALRLMLRHGSIGAQGTGY